MKGVRHKRGKFFQGQTESLKAVGLHEEVMWQLTEKIAKQQHPNIHSMVKTYGSHLNHYILGINIYYLKSAPVFSFKAAAQEDEYQVSTERLP